MLSWNKRKQILKENEWEYTRESLVEGMGGSWVSQSGNIVFPDELKEMDDEEFTETVKDDINGLLEED